MLTLSTMALYSCGEKAAETNEEETTTESTEVVAINGTYNVEEGAVLTWNARHYKDTDHAHTGTVNISEGSVVVENANIVGGTFEFDMTNIIEPGTDTTQPWTLEGHLKMADIFNIESFPGSTFTISGLTDGVVTGNLEVIGVSKEISFPAEVEVTQEAVNVKGEFDLDLLQFEIPMLVAGDTLPEVEKNESANPNVTFQLDFSASKAAH